MIALSLPGSQCIRWGTDSQWHNFCWVKPCHTQPANGEECIEDKEEYCLSNTCLFIAQVHQTIICTRKYSHRQRHSGGLYFERISQTFGRGFDSSHTPNNINGRRPTFSIMKIGMNAAIKYSVPLHAASNFGRLPCPSPMSAYSEGA